MCRVLALSIHQGLQWHRQPDMGKRVSSSPLPVPRCPEAGWSSLPTCSWGLAVFNRGNIEKSVLTSDLSHTLLSPSQVIRSLPRLNRETFCCSLTQQSCVWIPRGRGEVSCTLNLHTEQAMKPWTEWEDLRAPVKCTMSRTNESLCR